MSGGGGWSPISAEETRMVADVVEGCGKPHFRSILDDLVSAEVSREADWVLDIRTERRAHAVDVPDGPLPVRVYVIVLDDFLGEIIIWMADGHISGLEYAWVTDQPPTRWPSKSDLQFIAD